ncbi:MAG: tol-pal system protein [Paracoccus sp. (in: a-proteobacteria)]|nr:tol-pal system protein [Paracoccus sp. (in: a-proteobacteria)]
MIVPDIVTGAEGIPATPQADPRRLAEMQAALRAVASDLQALRAELVASGAQGFAAAGGDSAIDRMNAMEARIAALTDETEQLSNRIAHIVRDGSNRLGDIEFRLCEMDPNCDLGALMTAELGGQGVLLPPPPPGGPDPLDPALPGEIAATTLPPMAEAKPPVTPPTEEEAREFAAVRAAIADGRWPEAIAQIDHLVSDHAGGPLTAEALFLRGVAQESTGQTAPAAESWLLAFSAAPDGPRAAASLAALSRAMAALGQPSDACPYLDELTRRFPASPEASEALDSAAAAGCADLQDEGLAD